MMERAFNSDMLRLARELRGWTQSRLSSESGITQAYISLLEHGQKEASDKKVDALSKSLGVPTSFFYQSEQYDGFGLSLVFHRKRASTRISHLRRLQAEVNLRRIHATRLLRGIDLAAPNDFVSMDIDDYDGDAERIAQFVRINWKLPLGPIPDLVKVIENAGGIVFRFPFGTKDIDAISQWPNDAPPLFFVNADAPADRTRFSLAHELGHVVMHNMASETMEAEADRFASELLMPRREIASQLVGITIKKAYALKPYWRVAMQALVRRARDVGSIDSATYSRLFRRIASLGMRTREQTTISSEVPQLGDRLIDEFQESSEFTDSRIAAILCVEEPHFRHLYRPLANSLRVVGQ